MALADALSIDGEIQETKAALISAYHVIVGSGQEYAKLALKSGASILESAYAGAPCAAVYSHFYDFNHFTKLANSAVVSASQLSNIIAAIHESDDDEANAAYSGFLMDMSCTDQISALLEGATRRVEMANVGLPENPQPAARYNSTVFQHNDS